MLAWLVAGRQATLHYMRRVANSGGLSLLNSYHLDDIEEGIPRIIYIIISLQQSR
jgi:hypothetical protein